MLITTGVIIIAAATSTAATAAFATAIVTTSLNLAFTTLETLPAFVITVNYFY